MYYVLCEYFFQGNLEKKIIVFAEKTKAEQFYEKELNKMSSWWKNTDQTTYTWTNCVGSEVHTQAGERVAFGLVFTEDDWDKYQ